MGQDIHKPSGAGHPDYLFVDLDDTLIRTDLFLVSILSFIRQRPLNILYLLYWLLRGRAVAKALVAKAVNVEVEFLPYESGLVEYLRAQKSAGRCIVLATASHRRYARQIAGHLGLFDHVLATDARKNLKGKNKLAAIRDFCGNSGYCYAGDSLADRVIWADAETEIHVNSPGSCVKDAESKGRLEMLISSRGSILPAFVREMRVFQWTKNLLILVPLLTSHNYQDPQMLVAVAWAFLSFSLCASGVYFINDLLDLPHDRKHPLKRQRPLASGDLPLPIGVAGSILLPALAFLIAWFMLSPLMVTVLAIYFTITTAYSFFLKRIAILDVITLAVLYTLRLVAGSAATGIVLSSWLLVFSMFVFVSLAYLKRYNEVVEHYESDEQMDGRGYRRTDEETMFGLGVASSTAAVLVLALYISSEEITALYPSPHLLWLLCLLFLFWTHHLWLGARRRIIHEDPVIFAIKDRTSQLVLGSFLLVVLAARYIPL
ncbi:MAG: UbiA family prenyltransferase [Gammaproteobacteria bacterium]|nr:UbiA family prenyltransferase [Gammaproteobacteria bacterium]